jgi:hypothetical protein
MLTVPALAGHRARSENAMPRKSNHGQGHAHSSDAGGAGGFRNHGAEVSAAAHDAPRGKGAGHGQAVSDVARGNDDLQPSADPGTATDVAGDMKPGA